MYSNGKSLLWFMKGYYPDKEKQPVAYKTSCFLRGINDWLVIFSAVIYSILMIHG